MIDRLVNGVDDACGQVQGVVLRGPVVVGDVGEGDPGAAGVRRDPVVAVDGDALLPQRRERARQERVGDVGVMFVSQLGIAIPSFWFAILLILLFGFGIPALGINGLTSSTIVWGTVALIVSYSAYVAEVFRSGIDSVHPSQRAAARSLGYHTLLAEYQPTAKNVPVKSLLPDFGFIPVQGNTALWALNLPDCAPQGTNVTAS